jgi:hypothetical protein
MAIDLAELETWAQGEEGKAWVEAQKKPLIMKREELLEALKKANGASAQAAQRAADLERILGEERAAVERVVVDGELGRILREGRVMEPAIPGLISELRESYGLAVKADGQDRKAIGKIRGADGKETEADLAAIYAAWKDTAEAKSVTLAQAAGGAGAQGGKGGPGGVRTLSLSSFEALSPAERVAFTKGGGTIL